MPNLDRATLLRYAITDFLYSDEHPVCLSSPHWAERGTDARRERPNRGTVGWSTLIKLTWAP
jgi:hypothetical protein